MLKTRRKTFYRLLALILLTGFGYLLYLDYVITTKFDGKRWAVPARVYARPMELYDGATVSAVQLRSELEQLGYRQSVDIDTTASWMESNGQLLIHSRSFTYWDGPQPARRIRVSFSGRTISHVADLSGTAIGLARLEPVEIGTIYPAHHEDRLLLQRAQLPDLLVQSLIATEDKDFYAHHGLDAGAILRAAWVNLRAGSIQQGGSTLTQQLVKNFYLQDERSYRRKFNEALMAVLLELHYDKDEILTAYANEIYLGQDGRRAIHGFGLASYFYFNRPLDELQLPQLALLVALVRGPSYYDPWRHAERARQRRDLVIDRLVDRQTITHDQAQQAKSAPLGVQRWSRGDASPYPGFMALVRRQLSRDYAEQDLESEGLRIFTMLDPHIQQQAEAAVTRQLKRLESAYSLPAGKLQAAAVVASRDSGEVVALVGGRDAKFAGFNRAMDASRPIGSLVKPAVYLTALARPDEYTLISRIPDTELTIDTPQGPWQPQNYDHQTHGEVALHEALAKSYNLATIHLGLQLGIADVAATLTALGVEQPVPQVPAVLIGALSLTPFEVAQFYQTIAADGFYSPLRAIREIISADGTPLQRYPLQVRQAFDPAPMYLLNRNLQEVVSQGTARGLAAYLPADLTLAGKTGTSNELRDSWFAGFTGDKVGVVWLGRDDNQPGGLSGAQGALHVWGDIMQHIASRALDFVQPENVSLHWIDTSNGLLSVAGCNTARQFPFIEGSQPLRHSSCADNPLRRLFRNLFSVTPQYE